MKKNLFYRTLFGRRNVLKLWIFAIFSLFSSYPRLLLEVFIRKGFGRRYFKLSSSITIALILTWLPTEISQFMAHFSDATAVTINDFGEPVAVASAVKFSIVPYIAWYVYLVGFLAFSVKHYLDQRTAEGVTKSTRFSYYCGTYLPIFDKLKIPFLTVDQRSIECVLEPLGFLIAGIILALAGQYLGWLLIICSVSYSINYFAAYDAGDDFIQDKIDEMILNEELENTFVNDIDNNNGVEFRGRKPEAKEMREKILPLLTSGEDIFTAS